MVALTTQTAFEITETKGVTDCAAIADGVLSLDVREEPPAFIITKLKKDEDGTVQEYTSSLMHELFAAAKNMGIELGRSHFIFEEFGTTGVAGAGTNRWAAASQLPPETLAKQNEPAQKLHEFDQNPPPHSHYVEVRQYSALRQSLSANKERLVARVKDKLGSDYRVEFGVFDGKPAINITPSSLIEEILTAVGIIKPEQDKDFAKAVMESFAEILEKAPEKGDVVIAGERAADTLMMELTVPARERPKSKGRGLGM